MNRRNVIRIIAASAVLPIVPAASAAKTLEQRRRDVLDAMAKVPGDDLLWLATLSLALSPGTENSAYARGLLNSGMPAKECYDRVMDRVMADEGRRRPNRTSVQFKV